MENRIPFSACAFFAFEFFAQFISTLYAVRQTELPFSFFILAPFAGVWIIWWWLREDSRRRGISWMLDLGLFLMIAWPILLPYHLFSTRGLKALLPILFYILVFLAGSFAAEIAAVLFWPQ